MMSKPKKTDDVRIDTGSSENAKIEAVEYFLNDLFNNYLTSKTHLDNKIYWLLGISGLIMSLTLPYMLQSQSHVNFFGMLVISFSAFLTFLMCLVSLDIPQVLTKNIPESDNIMFYKHWRGKTTEDIFQEFKNIKTYDDIYRHYAANFYNLINRNIVIKNRFFKAARNTLFTGLVAGFIIIIVSFFL